MFHETIEIIYGAGYANKIVSGSVVPISADETYALGRNVNTVTYRLVLPPTVGDLSATIEFLWRTHRMAAVGPSMCHTINGRIHHYEIFAAKVGG